MSQLPVNLPQAAPSRRSARNDGAAAIGAERRRSGPGSPVTFCDGRTFFATASGQTQLTADILAAVQVVRPRLAAGTPRGPRLRADSDRNREETSAPSVGSGSACLWPQGRFSTEGRSGREATL